MNSQKVSKILIIAISAFITIGCGAKKTPLQTGDDSSSNGIPRGQGDLDNGSDVEVGYYSLCNSIDDGETTGILTTYAHDITGEFVPNLLRLDLSSIPSGVTGGSDEYIQIFRWTLNNDGVKEYNPTPVSMYFYLNGTQLNDSGIEVISQSSIDQLISSNSLDMDREEFIDEALIVLTGMELNWTALALTFYDDAIGSSAQYTLDALLPAFAADPRIYNEVESETTLQQLHPFFGQENSSMSEADFYNMSLELCI